MTNSHFPTPQEFWTKMSHKHTHTETHMCTHTHTYMNSKAEKEIPSRSGLKDLKSKNSLSSLGNSRN